MAYSRMRVCIGKTIIYAIQSNLDVTFTVTCYYEGHMQGLYIVIIHSIQWYIHARVSQVLFLLIVFLPVA